ncbi:winged helix-turn-helix domain-containing protein [Haladaptatus sp. QDMS2]|uniref:helix-turn-helix transcriptional regulator n=1 Tax=Haladaptatus sp. QDMS2 TaxID=3033391 RepID=UPI0023E8A532|nr:hypothetical protein [Haladaptatus sp. QDMS2]
MVSNTPLDDVEFLASSENRVTVLEALTVEPYTRGELHDLTGVSQPTLGRILEDFEDRRWIKKRERRYHLTRLGSLLADEFGVLLDTVETIQMLAELETILPLDEMDFDVRMFGDARITAPQPPDIFAHARRAETLAMEASHARSLTANFYPDLLPKTHELVIEGGQTQEAIVSAAAFDAIISQPGAAEIARELLESGKMTIYRYDGEVPIGFALFDEIAVIFPYDEQMREYALIETENETIRSWVEAQMDGYQEQATLITPAALPE